MSVLKQYNTGTSTWETIVVGQQGEPGIETGSVAPADTSVLWMDTADTGSQIAVPSGGNRGQVLAKTSATDYATQWSDVTGHGNVIINGGFDIWQRGTGSFAGGGYSADRWYSAANASVNSARVSVTNLPGIAYAIRQTAVGGGNNGNQFQCIETAMVSTLWGKTVTYSVKVRRNTTMNTALVLRIDTNPNIDAGMATAGWVAGSSTLVSNENISTTGWTTASLTVTIPNDGTANSIRVIVYENGGLNAGSTWDLTSAQLEVGSVATPFKRAGGTIQGELAACQRYYYRTTSAGSYWQFGIGNSENTVKAMIPIQLPVPMRTYPAAVEYSSVSNYTCVNTGFTTATSIALDGSYPSNISPVIAVGGTFTSGLPQRFVANNNSSAYLGFSAEL